MTSLRSRITAALGVALTLTLLTAETADARRGGSFGSRGARTYSAPRSTDTSPGYVAPVQRSMTAQPAGQPAGAYAPGPGQPGYAAGAPAAGLGNRFGGFGGGLMGGLLAGGLIGGLMGHGWGGGMGGFGGGGGLLTILIQIAVIALGINLLMRLFRRRQAPAGAMPWDTPQTSAFSGGQPGFGRGGFGGFGGGGPAPSGTAVPTGGPAWEISITAADQKDFERLLIDIQDAFGREDYAALRERSTPEVMSFLAEELSDNATHGRRNEVSGTKLVQADVGEAWREADIDYATAAMRYESIDLMRDRTTGAVLSGDPERPTQTVELWTFARSAGGPWKLSAIQAN